MAETWQQLHESGNRAFSGGLYESALEQYLRALELARRTGDPSSLSDTLRGIARTALELGRPSDALTYAQEAESIDREFWGYENHLVTDDMFCVAEALRQVGESVQAKELLERVHALRVSQHGASHDATLEVLIHLIWIELQQEHSQQLTALVKQATDLFADLHPAGSFSKALNIKQLLKPYVDSGREHEAHAITQRIEQSLKGAHGEARFELSHALHDSSAAVSEAGHSLASWRLQSLASHLEKQQSAQTLDPNHQPKLVLRESNEHDEIIVKSSSSPENFEGRLPPHQPQVTIDLHENGTLAIANSNMSKVIADCSKILDPGHDAEFPYTVTSVPWDKLKTQADDALASGLNDRALQLLGSALITVRRAGDSELQAQALRRMAELFLQYSAPDQALKASFNASELDREFWGEFSDYYAQDQIITAEALRQKGDYGLVRAVIDRTLPVIEQLHGRNHLETLQVYIEQIWIDMHLNERDKILGHLKEAAAIHEAIGVQTRLADSLKLNKVLKSIVEKHSEEDVNAICVALVSAFSTIFGAHHSETITVRESAVEGTTVHESHHPGRPARAAQPTQSIQPAQPSHPSGFAVQSGYPPQPHQATRVSAPFSVPPPANYSAAIHADAIDEGINLDVHSSTGPSALSLPANLNAAEPFRVENLLKFTGLEVTWNCFFLSTFTGFSLVGALSAAEYCFAGYGKVAPEAFFSGFMSAAFLTMLIVGFSVFRNQRVLRQQFPHALDLMVSLVQSGSTVVDSIDYLALNIAQPLRREFVRVLDAIKNGTQPDVAISRMRQYVNIVQIENLAVAVRANRSSGGNLANLLMAISRDMLDKQRERGAINGPQLMTRTSFFFNALPALLYLPMVCFVPSVGLHVLSTCPIRIFGILIIAAIALVFVHEKTCSPNQSIVQLLNFIINSTISNPAAAGEQIRDEFSRFLDLVVMHVQAGQSVSSAVYAVSKEAVGTCPVLCRELDARIASMTSFKTSVPNALREIGEKYKVDELIALSATFAAAAQTGSSVSYQLTQQSNAMRTHMSRKRFGRNAAMITVGLITGVGIMLFLQLLVAVKVIFH